MQSPTSPVDDNIESMEIEPGEIVENLERDDDILSVSVSEEARHAFYEEEEECSSQKPSVHLNNVRRSDDADTQNRNSSRRHNNQPSRSFLRGFNFHSTPRRFRFGGRRSYSPNNFSHDKRRNNRRKAHRFVSNDGFQRAVPSTRDKTFFYRRVQRRAHRSLVFCTTEEGYTLTDGTNWHTSDFVSRDSWIEDVWAAIRYLTNDACYRSEECLEQMIIYVPDNLSWRRMDDVITRFKNYWTCNIFLRKVEIKDRDARWTLHHRDMAEKLLKKLSY